MSSELPRRLLSPSICCSLGKPGSLQPSLRPMAHEHVLRESVEVGRAATSFRGYRDGFYALELLGLVGAVLMLLTAIIWRKVVRRHASWLNFMTAWIISCASYLFLMAEPVGRHPNHNLCLFQAALVYSVPTLTSGATLALVIHVHMTLRSLLTLPTNHQRSWTPALVIGPYVPAWAIFTYALKVGLNDPSLVHRLDDGTYCDLAKESPQRVSSIVVVIIMVLCLAVEVVIFRHLWRAWESLKRDDQSSVSIIVRVLAFTLVGMLSIILSLFFLVIPDNHDMVFNIVIAIPPVSSVIIFGTQKDIFTAWASGFWNRRAHGADTWDTFTPNESRRNTVSPQVSQV
ncbi:hypothetical protein DFH08DRAFT_878000 [Mycena albidolilacea]|uniref:G-protein coupled receptors family 2 profile 2 domain-containing protein n=1 Tax=Mycena albidolilacea TaxID=1033008 RepID=A0AAD6ZRF2_9AGAR|nr:hypothetical protein DFH08DRAFT_878000 [Mycena albidolilacea]